MRNRQLSEVFSDMSSIYKYLGGAERFRASAYQKAAKIISNLENDVEVYLRNKTLKEMPGIGESILSKIEEFISTGKIRTYEKLKQSVPVELIGMMEIRGFGPGSLRQIHNELGISDKEDLSKALLDGRISKLKGFGTKKTENMLRGLKLHKTIEERLLLWDAQKYGENVIAWFKKIPEVKQAELAGSLRRKKETVGDIDVLISCEQKHRKKIVKEFISSTDLLSQILVKGDTKVSAVLKDSGKQIDLRIVNEDEWGSALQYFTGSKEHNIHLRTIAREKGYKVSEYGVFRISDNKRIAGKSEKEVYAALGLSVMPPEIREDSGEIQFAEKNKIPALIELSDIKGDLQMHSVWSDGLNSIEQIAEYVLDHYDYEYIVITDHSKSSRIAKGLDEKQILKQLKEIDQVNKKLGKDFVKKGIEVDILSDGSLDISDEVLSKLDWVTASIHNGFNRDNTDRIIQACNNPYVDCIGHPTGRLIGLREPYEVDFDLVFKKAKETGTSIEINAQPNRMDLNENLAKRAKETGVKLVISTDAHESNNFEYMKLGVSIARRAWCTANDILNTRSWGEIKTFKNQKKRQLLISEQH